MNFIITGHWWQCLFLSFGGF